MKIQELFDLLGDAQDVLSYFANVENPQQLVSRLERLKRQAPEELLEDLFALKTSLETAFTAHIELGGSLSSDEEIPDGLGDLLGEFDDAAPGTSTPGNSDGDPPPTAPAADDGKPPS